VPEELSTSLSIIDTSVCQILKRAWVSRADLTTKSNLILLDGTVLIFILNLNK
jgi:hypothetical protein